MRSVSCVTICLLFLALAGCAASGGKHEPRVENDFLAFSLPDLAGDQVSSSSGHLRGKVVLVTLWGTWCPPCLSEIPTFNKLQDKLGEQGLEIVAIAFEKEEDATARRDRLRAFVAEQGIDYLVLDGGTTADFTSALPMVDDVEGLPVEILIGRDGMVSDIRHGYGFSEEWVQGLEDRLLKLLAD